MSTDNKLIVKDQITGRFHEVDGTKEVIIDPETGQEVHSSYTYGAHDYSVDEWRARMKRGIRCTLLSINPVEL